MSKLIERALEAAKNEKEDLAQQQAHREANWRGWASKTDFILSAAEDALYEFLSDGRYWLVAHNEYAIEKGEHHFPPIHFYAPRQLFDVHYTVDGIPLVLRCHYKTEYEDHPFEKWAVYAVHENTRTHVGSLAQLGWWIQHYHIGEEDG